MAREAAQEANVDPQDDSSDRVGKIYPPPSGSVELEDITEVLTRYEQMTRLGVNGLIEQGAKYVAGYNKSITYLEAFAEVCVALMTKYPAPVWDGPGDPRSEANKTKARGFVAAKDKDKKIKDWAGRSDQYQKSMQKIYDKAGVGNNEAQIRNNLKYWRQNLVKKVAPADDLIALGMKTARRGAGGLTNQTQKATGASKTTTTGQVTDPIKVIEQIGPRVVQLQVDVIKKGVVKTDKEKAELANKIEKMIDHLIAVHEFLVPKNQTAEATAASEAEEKRIADAKK